MRPTILQRLGAAAAGVMRAFSTREWEGSEIDRRRARWGKRLVSQDTDLDYGTREAMISEARRLVQTYGIAQHILSKFAQHTVGSCRIQFNTDSEEFNDRAEEHFEAWKSAADAQGLHHFNDLTRIAVKSMVRDGDIFAVKTRTMGFSQLQMIEADRVTNANGGDTNYDRGTRNVGKEKGEKVIGGVLVNTIGQPIAYRVNERDGNGFFRNPKDIRAPMVCHVYMPSRAEAYRGVTHFATALNDLRDIKEIKDAEKVGVKLASKWAMIVKNNTGAAPRGVNLFDEPGAAGEPGKVLEEISDGIIQYMFPGEDAKAFTSERPSAAWIGFMVYLIRSIAVGLNLPFEFVWDMAGLGGPGVRMMSKQAERTFNETMDVLERKWLTPIASWVTTTAMVEGRLPFNAQWQRFRFQRPAHPSIDVGRESQANLNEHGAGLISGAEIAAERGQDIYDILDQKAREARYAMDAAEKFNVPLEMVMGPPKGVASQPANQQPENGERQPPGRRGQQPSPSREDDSEEDE